MGQNTAAAQRSLADKAKARKDDAARKGDMLEAMVEQHCETDYRKRAGKSERDSRSR